MKAFIDLHIHSALSPCSDEDMTPNNIVNMAKLKGLDIIAVTDHNSLENYDAIDKCSKSIGILVVPGMELETREEVHLLCLFPNKEAALKAQTRVYSLLPDVKNRADIFGEQIIMDENDDVKGFLDNMLITAVNISIEEAFEMVYKLGGLAIPAHVDRESYSIISNLGIIPPHLNIKYLEISKNCTLNELLAKYRFLGEYKFVRSSDAHRLEDILEMESFIELNELSIECLMETLRRG